MEFDAFSSNGGGGFLQPCTSCGRKFNPESLTRHQPICERSQTKKRGVFDSGRQRAEGIGISISKVHRKGQPQQTQPVKITNWRQNHLDFVNNIRSARLAQKAIATGGPLPPPPPPSINPDYIPCPHCHRRFNQTAGARHIPVCGARTKLHGAPVTPLHKKAAADVRYSSTGIRKAYDNKVVQRKGNENPYIYQQGNTDVTPMRMYSATYGDRRLGIKQGISPKRPSLPSTKNSSIQRQSLPFRKHQGVTPSSLHGNSQQGRFSSVGRGDCSNKNFNQQQDLPFRNHQSVTPSSLHGGSHQQSFSSLVQGDCSTRLSGHQYSPSSVNEFGHQNDYFGHSSGDIEFSNAVSSAVAVGNGRRSGRPESSVRCAEHVEKHDCYDTPSPHPPPYPPPPGNPPSYHQSHGNRTNVQQMSSTYQLRSAGSSINHMAGNSTNWYGNQGNYRTTKASKMRLQRGQTPKSEIRASPRVSQESLSPGREDKSLNYELTTLNLGQKSLSSNSLGEEPPLGSSSPSTTHSPNDQKLCVLQHTPMHLQNGKPPNISPYTRHATQHSTDMQAHGHAKSVGPNGISPKILASLDKMAGTLPARYCFHCGTQYPVPEARFCCGCGVQRAFLSQAPLQE